MNKRCTNCGKFPFCEEDFADGQHIDNCWIKRERNLKLENTDGYNFDFENIENHIPNIL